MYKSGVGGLPTDTTIQCFAGKGAADVKAVLDGQHGREPRTVVNKAVLESEKWRQRVKGLRVAVRGIAVDSLQTMSTLS
jgi:hypothetical protein